MKVMTIVGTRPEIIKLSRVIAALDGSVEHVLVHTGQNYDVELNEVFFRDLDIRRPDLFLNAAGPSAAATIGNVIARADEAMGDIRPDALLVLGDTNSCLSVIAAKRRKIPIFHMEAGNRCFDQRVPEEINRKIVDHISDINLPYTEHARRYLLAEGLRPETIIKTGSPMREVLCSVQEKIGASTILERCGVAPNRYFIVSAHREENVDIAQRLEALLTTLNAIAARFSFPVIVSLHPRTAHRLNDRPPADLRPEIVLSKPFGFVDYIALQKHAACVLSDSGTITEEASLLGFPAVTLRDAHERPEGMDEGTLIMCGLHAPRVLAAIEVVCAQRAAGGPPVRIVADYNVDNVSQKVVRIIMSYIDYVNRTTWFSS